MFKKALKGFSPSLRLTCCSAWFFYIIQVFSLFCCQVFSFSPRQLVKGLLLPLGPTAHFLTFSSTCSYLARLTGILKAWKRAICCSTLHHFTPSPSSFCMHPDFSSSETQSAAKRWRKGCFGLSWKSLNHHLAEGKDCAG